MNEFYLLLQKRTIYAIQKIRGLDTGGRIKEMDDKIFELYTPQSFAGRDSEEIAFIKGFEEAVIYMAQFVPRDPKGMTVLEFYQTLETIKKQTKKSKKLNGQQSY